MPKPENIKGIVIHCSAGYGDIDSVKRFWKSLGWRSPGYHRFIDTDGTIHRVSRYGSYTNGVKGYNSEYVHISYQGGVNPDDYSKAVDTRTQAQKLSLQHCISDVMLWLESKGEDPEVDFCVVGHRDFSPDQNSDGHIAGWERIKECPSFDAMHEYLHYTSIDRRLKLPTDR
jgi:N-acetylmuramoyl-L-alanine amidase